MDVIEGRLAIIGGTAFDLRHEVHFDCREPALCREPSPGLPRYEKYAANPSGCREHRPPPLDFGGEFAYQPRWQLAQFDRNSCIIGDGFDSTGGVLSV